jgi:hypothetical protein
MIDIRNKYHIALNDIGYVLQNAPESPAYVLSQATLFNNRLAQGDRTYDDFAQWWYWAQTDWSQGIKNDVSWQDDGKYYLSTNIDAFSEVGSFKLASGLATENNFTPSMYAWAFGIIGNKTYKIVGTDGSGTGSNRAQLFKKETGGSWTEVSGTTFPTTAMYVTGVLLHKSKAFILLAGVARTTFTVCSYDDTSFTDHTADINTAMGWAATPPDALCGCEIDGVLYIALRDTTNFKSGIVKTADGGTTWVKVLDSDGDHHIVDMIGFNGNLFYIRQAGMSGNTIKELRMYDIANSVDVAVEKFISAYSYTFYITCGHVMFVLGGKLVFMIPARSLWSYETDGTLTRLITTDAFRSGMSDSQTYDYDIREGGIAHDNKIFFNNLIYDGANFFNWKRNVLDGASDTLRPVLSDGTTLYYVSSTDLTLLLKDSGFKTGVSGDCFLVFNNFDKVSALDKIAFSVTILFKKFLSGQSIVVEYLTGEFEQGATWTALGTASYTLDGASATQKVLYFPNNTSFKKIWFRVKMNGDGSNTPTLKDLIMAYLPTPFLDKEWSVNIDCGNEIKLLNGSLENRRGRELKGKLEAAWLTRQILDFQDVDYAATVINITGGISAADTTITVLDTSEFPEAGRIRIGDEIIYYAGKSPVTFTGCLRGRKGTLAVAHADTTAVNNGYKAMIQNFKTSVPILNNDKDLEYVVALNLREII